MSSTKSLEFEFQLSDPDGALVEDWQILLHIVADFQVLVDSRVLYREQQFCVVDFAVALHRWVGEEPKLDFIYESMESEEPGLVWVRASGSGWRVGSVHQEYDEEEVFSSEQVSEAAGAFIFRLKKEVAAKLDIDLRGIIEGNEVSSTHRPTSGCG
jgi:hypothetical protein